MIHAVPHEGWRAYNAETRTFPKSASFVNSSAWTHTVLRFLGCCKRYSPSLSLYNFLFLLYQHNFVIFLMMLVVCKCIVCFVSFCFSYAMLWSVLCMSAQKPALLLFSAVSCSLTVLQTSCWKNNAFLTHLWNVCGTARKLRTSLYFQKVSHE